MGGLVSPHRRTAVRSPSPRRAHREDDDERQLRLGRVPDRPGRPRGAVHAGRPGRRRQHPSATTKPAGTAGGSAAAGLRRGVRDHGPGEHAGDHEHQQPGHDRPDPRRHRAGDTAPAVQTPASTPVSTSAPTTTEQTSQTSYKPSERRVALSTRSRRDDAPRPRAGADVHDAGVAGPPQLRADDHDDRRSRGGQQAPSTDADSDWDGDSQPAEQQPAATTKPATPQVQAPAKTETGAQPRRQPEQPAAQPEQQPAATPQPQSQPAAQPQADPCPPAADPCPPAAEQAPAPAADTAAPKPPC